MLKIDFIETSSKMFTDDENDSLWLYDVLDIIGVNEEFRKISQRTYILGEIIQTFQSPNSTYYVGSRSEGIFTSGNYLCYCKRRIRFLHLLYLYSMTKQH